MDETTFELSPKALTEVTRRRDTLGAIRAAGMALLAALGLAGGSEAEGPGRATLPCGRWPAPRP
jgi:hypothetical protein